MAKATQMRLFPRGFLGADQGPQVERTPAPFATHLLRQQYHIDDIDVRESKLLPNPHVAALYGQYIKQSYQTGSFDFRKQVLQVAIAAFGTNNFEFWYNAQHKVATCGDLHNRFLTDTLKFIREGRREMSLETWQSLVTITDEGDRVGSLSPYAKEFFGIKDGAFAPNRREMTLAEVLQEWCSHPNGQEDLIGTLHILFGNT